MTENNIEKAKKRLDSVFDAFSIVADDTYVFLCDMKYDYSRWSKALVETFGLPSEYMYEAGKIWEEHIHPDDRQAYKEGIDAVFSGKQAGHDIQYRAKLPNGEYAICTCRGLVIKDNDGNPEYFGGAIRNHSQKSQIDASTEKLIGVEALLRWKNDEYGVVPPDMFIPFLETDPIFPVLGDWIIETALRDTKELNKYVPDAVVHVNLSYSQMEKAGFSDTIWNLLEKVELAPNQLSLEITECCRLLDMDMLRNVIVTLRAGGVRIALDDFGTGFSSLGLVKNLPFDTIKIDRSFVQHIETDEREKKLLNNCTNLAGNFGADVCVEGVETSGMRDIIKDYGIHSFQGYYYSKPIPIEELLEKVKNGRDCFAK